MRKEKPRTEKQIEKAVAKELRVKARAALEIKKAKAAEKLRLKKEAAALKKAEKIKIDGEIRPGDIKRIRQSLREAWMWSSIARKICIARATDERGFGHCENKACKKTVAKLYADHIEVMGDILAPDYIRRLWCHSSKLQALCKKCHDKKTKEENDAARSSSVKTLKVGIEDFF